jgi:acetyl esterase/lipase
VGVIALLRKAFALRPPPALRLRLLRWIAASVVREFPWALGAGSLLAIAALVALGALDGWLGIVVVAALAVWTLVLAWFMRQSLVSARAVREALADLEPPDDERRSDFPLSHLILPPLMLWPRGVRHVRGVEYARDGARPLRLDVYQPVEPADGPRPAIVQVHGGGWIAGSRSEQGIPLLNHLAVHGWVGFNIDYRLSPRATFPDHLVDVKRAIAWVREHAEEYGADPGFVCLTGGSAGGHLCALAALTSDDRSFQPGFEDADTSVAAAVPFYGVYDLTNADGDYYPELLEWVLEQHVFKASLADQPELFRAASPTHRVHADAPPFLVLHGDRDSLVPVADARRFVRELRAVSSNPVLYAELGGAEHAFDILPSVRTARVVETIERFLATVRADELPVALFEAGTAPSTAATAPSSSIG